MDDFRSERMAWIDHWKKTGPLLAKRESRLLKAVSLPERQQQIKNLLELAWQFRYERTDCGLSELAQRLSRVFRP